MEKQTLAVAAVAVCLGTSVAALDIKQSEIRFGTEHSSIMNMNFDGLNVAADMTLGLADRVEMDLGFAIARPDPMPGFVTEAFRLSVAGRYAFDQGVSVGAFLDAVDLKAPVPGGRVYTYGLDARYHNDKVDARVFYGLGDYTDLGLSEKSDAYGVDFSVQVEHGIDLGAYYMNEDYEMSSGLAQYGLTIGYLLNAPSMPVPLYVSGYIGQLGVARESFDQVGVTLSVPLHGTPRPGRRMFSQHSTLLNTFANVGAPL